MKVKHLGGVVLAASLFLLFDINAQARYLKYADTINFTSYEDDIAEEQRLGDMELIAQLIQAEAGNQSLDGKRLVADVIINRVNSPLFPNTVEEVIFQDCPLQFSVTKNGAWEKAAYNMEESDYKAVELEWDNPTNTKVLYFNNSKNVGGSGKPFKVGDHYFNH